MDIRPISAAETRTLRGTVLRPGQPPENLVYPGDTAAGSFHAGAFLDGALVGIASVFPEPMPRAPAPPASSAQAPDPDNAFRLRGMATRPDLQGQGIGRATLRRCIDHVRNSGADVLWCNARTSALPFYAPFGFQTLGDEFDIEGIGPHFVMWTDVRTPPGS